MKKIFSLVLVSALGGILTLGAYKLLLEDNQKVVLTTQESTPTLLTSNTNGVYNAYENPDFTNAAENTVNTVVHVKNLAVSRGQMTFEDFFFGRRSQRAEIGTGSGVIISEDGYIVTNNHVIDNSQELSVTLNNNKTYNAEIVGSDPNTDIALLKIEADEDLPFIAFGDSDEAKIGEWVLAVGNPFNLTSTVTAGIISAKARDLSGRSSQSFIQTDAAVNPGNSGGALVNSQGQLIGINTAITSQTGSYVGYSFAVPSNIARRVIEDIMEYGDVQNGILGIEGQALNSNSAEKFEINDTEGIYVTNVLEGSGADKAGIKEGDIIKEIDHIKISKFSDLTGHINAKRINDLVNLKVSRNGDIKSLPVKLTKDETVSLSSIGVLKQATKEKLDKYNLKNGFEILRLNDENKIDSEENGIKKGDIVTSINGKEITSIEDIENIKSNSRYGIYSISIVKENGEKVAFRRMR
ncbi:trypsin-like peptidase domain-containing protein [Flavobacteriaceae bacterium XHP0103]|uniref:trypsin-like peptidase domain-containing protein n=1 Tax=Marixanthotalea marina TaxID=2844359 RepID=UPI002989ADD8|nr:trypsin-like peptidase domain-containing protein [Marixanthotalea marina]MBU3822542.1 trypsin-like peptidase domain-containing protein [Marixanthotalea marina]